MISSSPLLRSCSREQRGAFTLIELLTVIAIILVLAGLLLNIAGSANYKGSLSRATAEIQAMSAALESYKADNGTYPRNAVSDNSITSDTLNAQTDTTDPTNANYVASGKVLYQALSGYTNAGTTPPNKAYMTFKPSQLSTGNAAPTATTLVIDPFGINYGYSTANLKAQDTANANNPPTTPDSSKGYNPTFDLWSTAGYGTGGKSYPSGLTAANYNTLWAKNW